MRREFTACVYAYNPRKGVLLIKHKRFNTWLPVGGERNTGETPLETARRELEEETGLVAEYPQLTIMPGTPPGLIAYEEHEAGEKGYHMNFCFVGIVNTTAVKSDGSYTEHKWVPIMSPEIYHEEIKPNVTECLITIRNLYATGRLGGPSLKF